MCSSGGAVYLDCSKASSRIGILYLREFNRPWPAVFRTLGPLAILVPLLRLSRLRRRPTSDRFQVLLWLVSLRGAPGISPFHGDRTARDNALSSRLSAFARVDRDTRPHRCERFVRRASKQPAGQLAPRRLHAQQRQRTFYARAFFVPLSPCSPCNLLSNNRSLKTSEQTVESA